MAPYHTVKQGECLTSIAKLYGFSNYRTIYAHPQNADFRKKRPNPNVIYPGDEIFIPERQTNERDCDSEKRHRFQAKMPKAWLRIIAKLEQSQPLSNKKYELQVGSVTHQGKTNQDGLLIVEVPPDAGEGTLTIWKDDNNPSSLITWQLKIGCLDPVEEISGIQGRLRNLGFDCGPVDGILGPRTREAVELFQESQGLKVDGIPGPETQAKLKEIHGC